MAQYIPTELRELLAEKEPASEVRLAIVPEEGLEDDIRSRVEDNTGISLDRELPSGVMLVDCQVGVADDFLSTASIVSASLPDRAKIME